MKSTPKEQFKATNNNNNINNEKDDISPFDDKDDCNYNDITYPWMIQTLAIFGDSPVAVVCSFVLLLLSIGMVWCLDQEGNFHSPSWRLQSLTKLLETDPIEAKYRQLGPIPDWIENTASIIEWKDDHDDDIDFVKVLKADFDRDGVIAIRGLIGRDLLDRLDQASLGLVQTAYEKKHTKPRGASTGKLQPGQPTGTQFFTVKEGAIFLGLDSPINGTTETEEASMPAFLEVALKSKIPQVISQILLDLPSNETLRLMRDIFLAKDTDEYVCGWHVDDTGFWPATAEAPGVNAWIALDDMPVEGGGGLALAIGSHTAPWRHEAYEVTGSTHTFPPEGFTSARDILERRVGNGTCNIAAAAPHLHRRMEETKRIYNVKRGDVILQTRWMFHRTVPFERRIVEDRQQEEPPLLYRRYSIRYGPGSSKIPRGYGTEPSVLWAEQNGGRTADEVAAASGPWYPQAWPEPPIEQTRQLHKIATARLPKVTPKADARREQMRKTRRAAARHQLSQQPH